MPGGPHRFVPVWRTAPFVRLVLPLGAGILAGRYLFGQFQAWWLVLAVAFACFAAGYLVAYRRPVLFGISVFIFWMVTGAALYHFGRAENSAYFIGNKYIPGSLLEARLHTPLEAKPNSWRTEVSIRQYDSVARKWAPLHGRVILYLAKDSLPRGMGMGSILFFKKTLQPIRNSGNPGGFDYKNYAAMNGWYHQVYLLPADFIVSEKRIKAGWRQWPIKARDHLIGTLRTYMPNGPALGVAEALLTGYRNDMDKELAWQYAGTGVAHIIAISGLHLGMIQAGLLVLLLPLTRLRQGIRLRAIIVIVCLWVFAFITGAGPSVLRSALMFSLLLFGDVIGRKGNSYNSLAASAFILLLIQPNLLFHVGFQLSYSAVLSILLFSGPISRWIQTRYRSVNKGWQMLSVTLAAQVLTLPFVVFYFNQFPVYFLLANLVAVPLTWLALNLCLLLGIFFWWQPFLAAPLGKAIDVTIRTMNRFIAWIHQLPMSRVENIHLSVAEAVLLMGVIALLSAWLLLRHKSSFVWALAGVLSFVLYRQYVWQQNDQQRKLIIYNINRHSAIDLIKGHQVFYWGDEACLHDPLLYRMNIRPSRILHQVQAAGSIPAKDTAFQRIRAGNVRMIVLDKDIDLNASQQADTDILLIATNLRARPDRVLEKISCRQIVADAKLPFYRVAQWQIAADSLHLPFHPVAEKGAFVLDLHRP
ncbi:MAG TPA: ComEC/Rec2 family competence protein [Phnomibacter sp.]|nr:ComEC/Rec2 family competence protein [Phnomibacter sp.]